MTNYPHLDGVTHQDVDLPGGLRMHVAEAGQGDPVLLLHGFPQNWWEWRGVIPGLAQNHRVIVPDQRGTGWTDAPATGYERDQLLADVVALLDALEIDRVHLVGHDWGALIGFLLCFEHPERVRSFMSIAIPHPYIRFTPKAVPGLPAPVVPVRGRHAGPGSQAPALGTSALGAAHHPGLLVATDDLDG